MEHAVLEGWLYLPHSAIGGERELAALCHRLTYTPAFDDGERGPIRLYDDTRPGFLGVPRAFGSHFFRHVPVIDRTSMGEPIQVPRLPDPNHPRVKDPIQQAAFMTNLEAAMHRHKTFIASAGTGTGKTVCSLRTAAVIGRSTIVILHLQRLLLQWRDEIMDKLGLPESQIGIIQQDRCDYEGKAITLAMGPSLASRRYDPAMYEYFGLKIVDEVHKFGTRMFAPLFPQINSHYALGLSATVERDDGGDRVFFWHLGPIRVISEAETLECEVYVLDYDCGPFYELWGTTPQARAQCLSKDPRRNERITYMIKRFYDAGRQALIVGDSIAHLQKLMEMAKRAGVPESAMGQFTGEIQQTVEIIDPRTGRKRKKVKKIKRSQADLDFVKANSQIIFATYGMMTEGIDVPRLDAGMDVTPRGKATQLLGRIRRPMPGKKKAKWVTLRDVRCPISMKLFDRRCKDYDASGAEVIYARSTSQRPSGHQTHARGNRRYA